MLTSHDPFYAWEFSVGTALHVQDTNYFFQPKNFTGNATIAKTMQQRVANFVLYGDPNGAGTERIPGYRSGEGNVLTNLNGSGITIVRGDRDNARCAWWH